MITKYSLKEKCMTHGLYGISGDAVMDQGMNSLWMTKNFTIFPFHL